MNRVLMLVLIVATASACKAPNESEQSGESVTAPNEERKTSDISQADGVERETADERTDEATPDKGGESRECAFAPVECVGADNERVRLCLLDSDRIHASIELGGERHEFVVEPDEANLGWCSFLSPHRSMSAVWAGPANRRVILASDFVNPSADEYHGGESDQLPDEPTWEATIIRDSDISRFECASSKVAGFDELQLEGATTSLQEGCQGFGLPIDNTVD